MGNPLGISDAYTDGVDDEVIRCIKAVKDLSPENVKAFLEVLFSGMSLVAKETVVDILWASMTLREQHLFDMPVSGRRLADEEIHRNFGSSELNVIPRRVVRGLQQLDQGQISRSMQTRTGITTQIWPRIGFSRALEDTPSGAIENPDIRVDSFPSQGSRRRRPGPNDPGEIGDHILTLLMDVVMRAEQGSNSRGDTGSEQQEQVTRRSRQ